MLKNILEKFQNEPITIGQWIISFTSIVFVRFLFEFISSPERDGIIHSNIETLVHYGLFWLTLTLGLILIIGYITKQFTETAKLALFSLPIIWIAPILDIILSRGNGFVERYIFDSGSILFLDFVTFFGPNLTSGATMGVRVEMLLVLICIGWYLYYKTKNVTKTALGIFAIYVLGFILGSLPGIIHTITQLFFDTNTTDSWWYFANTVLHSNLIHNTLRDSAIFTQSPRIIELGFEKLMSQVLLLISFVFGLLLFKNIDSKKFRVIVGNCRLERIGSYIALLLCGVGYAYLNRLNSPFIWIDIFGFISLILSWIGLWMFAVHQNDIADVKIDEISNTDRPLVKKVVDTTDMKEVGYVWLSMAIIGAFCAGFYPFFMALVYISCSHIYSSAPLRLRRFPLIPSALIGITSLATILAGFFFVSINKQIHTFPVFLSMGMVLMATLAINVKDMKDIEGDRENGIVTLPVFFGKNGPKVVGLCFALSFLLVPFFLSFYTLYIVAIPVAILGYRLVIKKPYREEPIFILRFVFLAIISVLYLGTYWIGYTQHII